LLVYGIIRESIAYIRIIFYLYIDTFPLNISRIFATAIIPKPKARRLASSKKNAPIAMQPRLFLAEPVQPLPFWWTQLTHR